MALPECHSFYHGEKVAFGALTGLLLTGAENPVRLENLASIRREHFRKDHIQTHDQPQSL
jgi:glycerol dehydrogenase-like iron-containing ADH family enzyme